MYALLGFSSLHCRIFSLSLETPLRRQGSTLERPKVDKSLSLPIHGVLAVMGNVRHPCRTRVSEFYFTQLWDSNGAYCVFM